MRTMYSELFIVVAFHLFISSRVEANDGECYTRLSEDPYHTHTIPTYKCELGVKSINVRAASEETDFKPQSDKSYHSKTKLDDRLAKKSRASSK